MTFKLEAGLKCPACKVGLLLEDAHLYRCSNCIYNTSAYDYIRIYGRPPEEPLLGVHGEYYSGNQATDYRLTELEANIADIHNIIGDLNKRISILTKFMYRQETIKKALGFEIEADSDDIQT